MADVNEEPAFTASFSLVGQRLDCLQNHPAVDFVQQTCFLRLSHELSRIQKATGIQKKSPAVKKAVEGYLHALDRQRFLQRVCEGRTDYSTTNEELEEAGTYDSD